MATRIGNTIQALYQAWLRKITTAGLFGKIAWGGCLPVFLFICACSILAAPFRGGPDSADFPAPTAIVTDTPEALAEGEASPELTTEPSPTVVPTPIPTEEPTPEPTATPEPPTSTPIPPPVELSGAGQLATDPFSVPSAINRVTFTHTGASNFIATAFGPDGQEELLVNAIGNYSGVRPLIGAGEWRFDVDADGSWSAIVEAISQDQAAAHGIEGTGDFVSGFFEPAQTGATPHAFSHNGQSNFVVQLHCASGTELLVNEIGTVNGSTMARFGDGPCMWEIQADGAWSITPTE